VDHPVGEAGLAGRPAVVRIVGLNAMTIPAALVWAERRQVKDCAPESVTPSE
jgi:hypothetical protein